MAQLSNCHLPLSSPFPSPLHRTKQGIPRQALRESSAITGAVTGPSPSHQKHRGAEFWHQSQGTQWPWKPISVAPGSLRIPRKLDKEDKVMGICVNVTWSCSQIIIDQKPRIWDLLPPQHQDTNKDCYSGLLLITFSHMNSQKELRRSPLLISFHSSPTKAKETLLAKIMTQELTNRRCGLFVVGSPGFRLVCIST